MAAQFWSLMCLTCSNLFPDPDPDPWSMIHDPWSMIHDPWSKYYYAMISDAQSSFDARTFHLLFKNSSRQRSENNWPPCLHSFTFRVKEHLKNIGFIGVMFSLGGIRKLKRLSTVKAPRNRDSSRLYFLLVEEDIVYHNYHKLMHEIHSFRQHRWALLNI